VEDNPDDVFVIRNACARSGFPHGFSFVPDGQAAIDYLAGTAPYGDRRQHPFPDLVFLDLKLPKLTGHEVLEWIRGQSQLKNLPVIMLTSLQEHSEVDRAYKLGVTSYLRKTADVTEFGQAIRVILKYWFELNIWPS
jgi:CheY-like chemotaxis protein